MTLCPLCLSSDVAPVSLAASPMRCSSCGNEWRPSRDTHRQAIDDRASDLDAKMRRDNRARRRARALVRIIAARGHHRNAWLGRLAVEALPTPAEVVPRRGEEPEP